MWRIFGLVSALSVILTIPAQADDAPGFADHAKVRIELAAGQRYRSQMIAKAACFAMSGQKPGQYAARALSIAMEFGETLVVLRDGDARRAMPAETDGDLLSLIDEAERTWRTLQAAAQQIVAGDLHSVPVKQMITQSEALLEDAQEIVTGIQRRYGGGDPRNASILRTIDLAGRQRMLAQRTARAYCFGVLGIDQARLRAALAEDVVLFATSMKNLSDGDPAAGIIEPPSPTIYFMIGRVQEIWQAYRAPLDRLIAGEPALEGDMETVESMNQPLHEALDRLVKAYLL